MSISISIVEDEARIRKQLAALIGDAAGFRCAGVYPSGEAALREIPRQPPDVVLMDINLGGMSGVECTFRLKKLVPQLQIVMLTVYDDSEQIFKALEVGASGYLLKRTPPDEILKAVNEVYHGGAPMSGYVARQVVQSFAKLSRSDQPQLAPREAEVLALVAKGYINKEIADRLGISLETVRSYLKNIYEKLHVRSRTEAAMKFFNP
ncbi:MAG: response regulator transcription factor [Verrucomicrobiota bacterium]